MHNTGPSNSLAWEVALGGSLGSTCNGEEYKNGEQHVSIRSFGSKVSSIFGATKTMRIKGGPSSKGYVGVRLVGKGGPKGYGGVRLVGKGGPKGYGGVRLVGGITLTSFVSECCVKDANGKVYCATLYKEYKRWCGVNGEQHMSIRSFGSKMSSIIGVTKTMRIKGGPSSKGYVGVRLGAFSQ